MQTVSKNNAIVWSFVAVAILVNIAGYLWNLYEKIRLFDEILHAFTTFSLTLLLAWLLYGVVLKGAEDRSILFVLTVVSLGLAVGALWEIAEWLYDLMVPANAILGKTDTIIDLVMDVAGATVAGILSVGMVKTKA